VEDQVSFSPLNEGPGQHVGASNGLKHSGKDGGEKMAEAGYLNVVAWERRGRGFRLEVQRRKNRDVGGTYCMENLDEEHCGDRGSGDVKDFFVEQKKPGGGGGFGLIFGNFTIEGPIAEIVSETSKCGFDRGADGVQTRAGESAAKVQVVRRRGGKGTRAGGRRRGQTRDEHRSYDRPVERRTGEEQ